MWLLGATTLELYEFLTDVPDYVILSHTWGPEEVSFDDIKDEQERQNLKGFDKILGCCQQALQDGFEWVWIDTCCIDKRSSAELSEAINSMYEWYWRAAKCYAYLSDAPEQRPFVKSLWFGRGWTLQELLAPAALEFYDHNWNFIGTKLGLADDIEEASGIQKAYIVDRHAIHDASVATKFSWASARVTTRIEDTAYCLLGLVGVNMPMLYGEGGGAFIRLQLELLKKSNDHSIFAWGFCRPIDPRLGDPHNAGSSVSDVSPADSVLATSPIYFRHSAGLRNITFNRPEPTLTHEVTNNGLRICLPCSPRTKKIFPPVYIAWLYCMDTEGRTIGIELQKALKTGSYSRSNTQLYARAVNDKKADKLVDMYLQVSDRDWFTQRWKRLQGGTASLRVNRIHTYRGCEIRFVSLCSEHDTNVDHDLLAWSATFTIDAKYIVNELIVPEDKVAVISISSPAAQGMVHLIVLGVHQSQPILFASQRTCKDSLDKNWYMILAESPNKWRDHIRDCVHVGDGSFKHTVQAKVVKEGTRLTWSATISAFDEADRCDFYGNFGLTSRKMHQENNLACYCLDCRYKRVVESRLGTETYTASTRASRLTTMQWQLENQSEEHAVGHVIECTCPICAKESRVELDLAFEPPFKAECAEMSKMEPRFSSYQLPYPAPDTFILSLHSSLDRKRDHQGAEASPAR